MKRRDALRVGSAALAGLGISGIDLIGQAHRYGRVLAASTPRKLALLVGINAYPSSSLFSPLMGCITDVELQRELLIHRFGFQPADILTLTDGKASREAILQAFQEHLIRQARPGDVVVFHFSGHGSRVSDPDRDNADGLNSTFVPVDGGLPEGFPQRGGTVQDITGHSLFLLSRAVPSEGFTAVLDSCHSGGGTRGNMRIRARPGNAELVVSQREIELQRQLLGQLGMTPAQFIQERRRGVGNGVVVAGTRRDQLAADASFNDVDCGVFTYLLTQYLWQQTSPDSIRSVLANVGRSTTRLSTTQQQPLYEAKPGSSRDSQPLYSSPQLGPPADGVVRRVSGAEVEVWLGGVHPDSLAAFGQGTTLQLLNDRGASSGVMELKARRGLVGLATVNGSRGSARPGQPVQEGARQIPDNLTLVVGLDPSLGADLAAAREALNREPRLKAVPLQQGSVHVILTRQNGLGLLSPGGDRLPNSFGAAAESLEQAVTRLRPKLRAALAAQVFKLTLNTNSSLLDLVVSLRPEGRKSALTAAVFPTRGVGKGKPLGPAAAAPADGSRLPVGTAVQFEISNREVRPLYISLLVIDPAGEMTVVFPNNWTASSEATRVNAGQTIRIPDPGSDSFQLVTQEPKGMVEVLIVASLSPIREALRALQSLASHSAQTRGPVAAPDPLGLMEDFLSDLSTPGGSRTRGLAAVGRTVDPSRIATLSLSFEVI